MVQRSEKKCRLANTYDLAVGGFRRPSDKSNEANAKRELLDNIGIEADESQLKLIGVERYQDEELSLYGNIYLMKLDSDGSEL